MTQEQFPILSRTHLLKEHQRLSSSYDAASSDEEEQLMRQLAQSYADMASLDIPIEDITRAELLALPPEERQKYYRVLNTFDGDSGMNEDALLNLKIQFGLED